MKYLKYLKISANCYFNCVIKFQTYVARKIAIFSDFVNYEEAYDATHVEKLAKVLALNTACKYGLKACNEFAERELKAYLNNEKT